MAPLHQYQPATHCIFDMDGLLLDSENIYRVAFGAAIARHDRVYTNDVKTRAIGQQPLDALRTIVKALNMNVTAEQLAEEIKELLKDQIGKAKFKPGAEKLVKHLAKHKIPMAIATSTWKDCLDIQKKNHAEIFNLFHHITASDSDPEIKYGKPAPDIFLTCASRFDDKPHPEKCIVFEDSPAGVEAAIRAKMQVVMVPDPALCCEMNEPATMVLKSLEEFRPEDFWLPAFYIEGLDPQPEPPK